MDRNMTAERRNKGFFMSAWNIAEAGSSSRFVGAKPNLRKNPQFQNITSATV
jgi:hypothetical protein